MTAKLVISEMETSHIINRIDWCNRQIIDPWLVHGDEPKYGAGGYSDHVLHDYNARIERHIKELEKELERRKQNVQM